MAAADMKTKKIIADSLPVNRRCRWRYESMVRVLLCVVACTNFRSTAVILYVVTIILYYTTVQPTCSVFGRTTASVIAVIRLASHVQYYNNINNNICAHVSLWKIVRLLSSVKHCYSHFIYIQYFITTKKLRNNILISLF